MRYFLKQFGWIIIVMFLMACEQKQANMEVRTGDILFRGSLNSELSKAINSVTQTHKATQYTHMGIVEVLDSMVWVYHAAPGKGVCRELLAEFVHPDETDSAVVGVYRLRHPFQEHIPNALDRAKKLIGQSYNYTYVLADDGYYCSEYIYEIWAKDSVFHLEPMTFKKPGTDLFHEGWIRHYTQLGIAIPEGKPGCNPNGMSASANLEFVMFLQ